MRQITRTERLRLACGESQTAFAKRLGVSQGTVWRLEAGQPETGPQSIILDALEARLASGACGSPASDDAALPADEVA